jgi:hypothetical protein
MTACNFVLEPFPDLPFPGGVRVSGQARRQGSELQLEWRLEGPVGLLALPLPESPPERRHGLWEATCFECFLASPDRPGYWEFNLSPAGHWNVFRFDGYRSGMRDETAFDALPVAVAHGPGTCHVSLRLDTTQLGIADDPWLLGISTVLAESDGHVTYWALLHPALQPDFHQAAGFRIGLGADRPVGNKPSVDL